MKKLEECIFPADWLYIKSILKDDGTDLKWAIVFNSVLKKRLESRYLDPINTVSKKALIQGQGEGFLILTIQCALIEFLAALKKGWSYYHGHKIQGKDYHYGHSASLFIEFLRDEKPFKLAFDTKTKAKQFYSNIRCGLVHEAQTKDGWRIWKGTTTGKLVNHDKKIVFRDQMTVCINTYLTSYGKELTSNIALQEAFIRKFDHFHENTHMTLRDENK